jgi:hypothetical protein
MSITGTYTGWPFSPALVNAPEGPSLLRGTDSTPARTTKPLASFVSNADGDVGPDGAEVYIATRRHNGATSALGVSNIQQTAGDSGCAIEAHMLACAGTAGQSATQFPLWITCQLWSRWDATSNEINTVNCTGAPAPGDGEYGGHGYSNALALICKGDPGMTSSCALAIAGDTAPWLRGIDFLQNSVQHYAIVLPNGKPVVARNGDNSAKYPVLTPQGDDLEINAAGKIYFCSAGRRIAWVDATGIHPVNPT